MTTGKTSGLIPKAAATVKGKRKKFDSKSKAGVLLTELPKDPKNHELKPKDLCELDNEGIFNEANLSSAQFRSAVQRIKTSMGKGVDGGEGTSEKKSVTQIDNDC